MSDCGLQRKPCFLLPKYQTGNYECMLNRISATPICSITMEVQTTKFAGLLWLLGILKNVIIHYNNLSTDGSGLSTYTFCGHNKPAAVVRISEWETQLCASGNTKMLSADHLWRKFKDVYWRWTSKGASWGCCWWVCLICPSLWRFFGAWQDGMKLWGRPEFYERIRLHRNGLGMLWDSSWGARMHC